MMKCFAFLLAVIICVSASALETDPVLGLPVYSTAAKIMQQAEKNGQQYELSKFFDGFSIIFEPVDLIWLDFPVRRIKMDFPEEDFESVAYGIEITYGEINIPWDILPQRKYSKYIDDLNRIYDLLNVQYGEPLLAEFYTIAYEDSDLIKDTISIESFKAEVTFERYAELAEKNVVVMIRVQFDGAALDASMFKILDREEKLSYKVYYSLENSKEDAENG